MKSLRLLLCLGGCLTLSVRFLPAQEPDRLVAPSPDPGAGGSPAPTPDPAEQPGDDPLLSPATGAEQAFIPFYPPGMFGDLLEIESVRVPVGNRLEVPGPVAFRSALRISDNESPRPLDRVFITGHDFITVNGLFLGSNASSASVYREMIGFEKTFLQGNASLGVRLPYFQLTGDPNQNETRIGDVSVILKYAFINDRATGHAFSAGLVVTAPTGPGLHFPGQSTVSSVILQPWWGNVWTHDRLFVQGFTSVAIPTDARDVAVLFKSIGMGYWLYRDNDGDRLVGAVVPDVELHLSEPLNHKGLNNLSLGFPVMLDFTGGFYVFLRGAVLGVGVGTPLTGPKPYEFMVNTSLNLRF